MGIVSKITAAVLSLLVCWLAFNKWSLERELRTTNARLETSQSALDASIKERDSLINARDALRTEIEAPRDARVAAEEERLQALLDLDALLNLKEETIDGDEEQAACFNLAVPQLFADCVRNGTCD